VLAFRKYASGCLLRIVRQPLIADVGYTQASSVIAVCRSSELASGTRTRSSTPSKTSAPPVWPCDVRVAPVKMPSLPLPETSTARAPPGSSNAQAAARLEGWGRTTRETLAGSDGAPSSSSTV
jgi:hypothetical protein